MEFAKECEIIRGILYDFFILNVVQKLDLGCVKAQGQFFNHIRCILQRGLICLLLQLEPMGMAEQVFQMCRPGT